MRLIILETCVGIFAVLFLATLAATAWQRARPRAGDAQPTSGPAEYLWTVVPWVIVAGSAFPAVRLVMAAP